MHGCRYRSRSRSGTRTRERRRVGWWWGRLVLHIVLTLHAVQPARCRDRLLVHIVPGQWRQVRVHMIKMALSKSSYSRRGRKRRWIFYKFFSTKCPFYDLSFLCNEFSMSFIFWVMVFLGICFCKLSILPTFLSAKYHTPDANISRKCSSVRNLTLSTNFFISFFCIRLVTHNNLEYI